MPCAAIETFLSNCLVRASFTHKQYDDNNNKTTTTTTNNHNNMASILCNSCQFFFPCSHARRRKILNNVHPPYNLTQMVECSLSMREVPGSKLGCENVQPWWRYALYGEHPVFTRLLPNVTSTLITVMHVNIVSTTLFSTFATICPWTTSLVL